MRISSRHLRFLILPMLLVAFVVVNRSGAAPASADTAGPKISAISVNAKTSQTATITFSLANVTTDQQVVAQIQYGTSQTYNKVYPPAYAAVQANDSLTIDGLTAATTYHYRLVVKIADSATPSDQSADRTFSTKANDSLAAPTITIQNVDCIDTQCIVTFKTATAANVTLGWDTVFRSPGGQTDFCTPESGYTNCASETTGVYLDTVRTLKMSGLTAKTPYHYRLQAIAKNENYVMTGNAGADFQITTAANSSDHTFSTGSCSENTISYPIGSCMPSGAICTADGPRNDCTASCGYNCSAGFTCNKSGSCLEDPKLNADTPTQCNAPACFNPNGTFQNPAPAGCYASWPRCAANTILKVQPDRGCNLWLTCGTSVQTQAQKNLPAENLCLALAACNQIGSDGQCVHYLPQGQCDNDPLRFCSNDTDCLAGGTCNLPDPDRPSANLQEVTYTTPNQVQSVAQLSGNIVAGLDWSSISGASVINGLLPWQLMRQIGGSQKIAPDDFGDFETRPPDPGKWETVPTDKPGGTFSVDFEDRDTSPNHVLKVVPLQAQNSGVASPEFMSQPGEYYYAEARIRSADSTKMPLVRFEVGYNSFKTFAVGSTPTLVDVRVDSTWQHVSIGPIKGLTGQTRIGFVCSDTANCSSFWVDDVQIKPVLQTNTLPSFVSPTCRLYPKEDSPACDYIDSIGTTYKGWHGYCLEHDSQTGNCLSWWPIDLISGENSVFGSAATTGYKDQSPLYFCAQAAGSNYGNDFNASSAPYTVGEQLNAGHGGAYQFCDNAPQSKGYCHAVSSGGYTFRNCSDNGLTCKIPTQKFNNIMESQIDLVNFHYVGSYANENPDEYFYNTADFHNGVIEYNIDGGDNSGYAKYNRWRDSTSDPNYIIWRYEASKCGGGTMSVNCNNVFLYFDRRSGQLRYYASSVNDQTGDTVDDVPFQVLFVIKDICQAVVQTVTPSGGNVAFSNRVSSGQYTVNDLGYKVASDFKPFGALVPPSDSPTDPTKWPTLTIESRSSAYDAPGQARGGMSYACVGNCAGAACHLADMTDAQEGTSCPNYPTSVPVLCAKDSNDDQKVDGICSGASSDATATPSNKGQQYFDATHNGLTPASAAADKYFAQNRLQRLFAQSYGVWSNLRCGGRVPLGSSADWAYIYSDTACTNNADCVSAGGTCSWQAATYKQVANAGWSPPANLCPTTTVYGPSICTVHTPQLDCPTSGESFTGPTAMTQTAAVDAAKEACLLITACDGSTPACTQEGILGTKLMYTSFSVSSYEETTHRVFDPVLGYRWLPAYQAVGNCTRPAAKYTKVDETPSSIKPTIGTIRPAAPNDYCAIAPGVSSAQFTNSASKVTIINGGGGSVGLSMKVAADAEQLPVQSIFIDWGDTQQQYPSIATVYSHVYSYKNDAKNCTKNGACVYHIKVQVKDNWGWCSEAGLKWCSKEPNQLCDSTSACGPCAEKTDINGNVIKCQVKPVGDHLDSTYWVDTGLIVVVYP